MLNTSGICCRRRRVMFEKLKIRNLKRARGVFFVNLTKKKKKKKRRQTVGPGTYIRSRKKGRVQLNSFFFKFLFIVAIP